MGTAAALTLERAINAQASIYCAEASNRVALCEYRKIHGRMIKSYRFGERTRPSGRVDRAHQITPRNLEHTPLPNPLFHLKLRQACQVQAAIQREATHQIRARHLAVRPHSRCGKASGRAGRLLSLPWQYNCQLISCIGLCFQKR